MRIDRILLLAALLLPLPAGAAGGAVELQDAGTNIHNIASLQRGARNFVNYCLGCHSLQYVRWNGLAADLELTESEVRDNLMFTGSRTFDTIQTAMPAGPARDWFGHTPPDLSLIARSRGVDYVYTYLKSFYADPARPIGVNNLVLANTAMPHVLAGLQGVQQPRYEMHAVAGSEPVRIVAGLEPGSPGELDARAYDSFVRDLVNFLDYVGEPVKAKRRAIGVWVMLFLLLFFGLTYFLKREYWKDVK